MIRAARLWRQMLVVIGLTLGAGTMPARAQFFFPFFDNRPSAPPNAELRRRSVHPRPESGATDSRSKSKANRAKAQPRDNGSAKPAAAAAATDPQAPVVEGPPPPYEPQLLRLAEIMGSLAYLQTLCAEPTALKAKAQGQGQGQGQAPRDDQFWRERMETLMTAEGAGPSRREKLAGAYNRGLQGYQYSYWVCTPSAQLARRRFLEEGAQLSHDISTQYRAN